MRIKRRAVFVLCLAFILCSARESAAGWSWIWELSGPRFDGPTFFARFGPAGVKRKDNESEVDYRLRERHTPLWREFGFGPVDFQPDPIDMSTKGLTRPVWFFRLETAVLVSDGEDDDPDGNDIVWIAVQPAFEAYKEIKTIKGRLGLLTGPSWNFFYGSFPSFERSSWRVTPSYTQKLGRDMSVVVEHTFMIFRDKFTVQDFVRNAASQRQLGGELVHGTSITFALGF